MVAKKGPKMAVCAMVVLSSAARPSAGLEPVDGFLPCGEEAEPSAGVVLASDLAEGGRVDREIRHHRGHADVVVRELLHELAGDAAAEIEERRRKRVLVEEQRSGSMLDAADHRVDRVDRPSAAGLELRRRRRSTLPHRPSLPPQQDLLLDRTARGWPGRVVETIRTARLDLVAMIPAF